MEAAGSANSSLLAVDTSSVGTRHRDVTLSKSEAKDDESSTSEVSSEGLPENSKSPLGVDDLKRDNDHLRKKVKYMENLGVLVTDFKQENESLLIENQALRRRLEVLEARSAPEQCSLGGGGAKHNGRSSQGVSEDPGCNSAHKASAKNDLETPDANKEANEVVDKMTSMFLSHAVETPFTDWTIINNGANSEDPTSSLVQEHEAFYEQINQLENMVGLNPSTIDSEASITESSVTSQFTKLAAVFAGLAQRVKSSQRKATKSQAFCEALTTENERLKKLAKLATAQVEALKAENQRLVGKMPPLVGKTPPLDPLPRDAPSSCVKLGASEEGEPGSAVILKLQARVKKLERQRAEILRVNKSWDTQYKRLKQELDKRMRDWEEKGAPSCSRRDPQKERRDLLLDEAKKEIHSHLEEKAELARSRSRAHVLCQALKRDLAKAKEAEKKLETDKRCLEAENARLNQALEAAYSVHERRSISFPEESSHRTNPSPARRSPEHPVDGSSEELQTRVEVLQEQVKIYREDFETERRDREKSQGEKQLLDEALTMARHEVQALSQQVRTHEQDFRQERREKERLQRQIQWYQGKLRDSGESRNRDPFRGDVNEPPGYYAHRFADDDQNQPTRRGSARRPRPSPPRYNPDPNNWGFNGAADNDAVLSYPPEGATDRPY